MPRKAVELSNGNLVRTPDLVESSEVATLPTTNGIPRANAEGKIAAGWVAPLAIDQLPVAASGENSATKVVRADDARLSNPAVGGDLSGTAQAATVVKLQGRALANTAPTDGQGLVWSHTNNRWEPAAIGGGGGGDGDATSIQGRPVAATAPATGDTLVWDGTAWAPAAGGGGAEESVGNKLILFERYW